MDGFEKTVDYYNLKPILGLFSPERRLDEGTKENVYAAVKDSLQYQSFLLGGHFDYPDIYACPHIVAILEYQEKRSFRAYIGGKRTFRVCLFPQDGKAKALYMDLFKLDKAERYIISTEYLVPVSPDTVSEWTGKSDTPGFLSVRDVGRRMFDLEELGLLSVRDVDTMAFTDQGELPVINPIGNKTIEGLIEYLPRCASFFAKRENQKLDGKNRVEVFLLGKNVDQFFFVHIDPHEGRHVYKYNLLVGWYQDVYAYASAKPESQDKIADYLVGKLDKPQHIVEFDCKP